MSLIARARRLLVLAGVAAVFAHAPVRAAEHEWTMQIAAQAGEIIFDIGQDFAERVARKMGMVDMILIAHPEATWARKAYLKYGFEIIESAREKILAWEGGCLKPYYEEGFELYRYEFDVARHYTPEEISPKLISLSSVMKNSGWIMPYSMSKARMSALTAFSMRGRRDSRRSLAGTKLV